MDLADVGVVLNEIGVVVRGVGSASLPHHRIAKVPAGSTQKHITWLVLQIRKPGQLPHSKFFISFLVRCLHHVAAATLLRALSIFPDPISSLRPLAATLSNLPPRSLSEQRILFGAVAGRGLDEDLGPPATPLLLLVALGVVLQVRHDLVEVLVEDVILVGRVIGARLGRDLLIEDFDEVISGLVED